LKVAFASPELQSLVRRTNLAEVAEYLPRALAGEGADVRVILPYSQDIEQDKLSGLETLGTIRVSMGGEAAEEHELTLHRARLGELQLVLLDHPTLFRERHPYGDGNGPYEDNWQRYAIFSRAFFEVLEKIDFTPDVIHCFDWTTGLIPVIHKLEHVGRKECRTGRAGVFFSVNNVAIQGSFERSILPHIGLPHRLFQAIEGVELAGKVNFLKAGAEFATIVGTFSEGMVERLQSIDRGDGLDDTFRRRTKELVAVQNGIDYATWDPETDPLLPQNFSASSKEPAGKKKCKSHLQTTLNLDPGTGKDRMPLIAVIGRFDADSGFDVLGEALTPLLERNLQLVLMGPAQEDIGERLRTIETTFAGRCRYLPGYHLNTAHALLGGADMLLLPAHSHATGALCAIAMRYGVSPIAYASSGLEDIITNAETHPKNGTGFLFEHYSGESLIEAVDRARGRFKKAADWKPVVASCLAQDFSWQESAKSYIKAYRRVTRRVRGRKS